MAAPVNTVLVSKICSTILLTVLRLLAGLLPLKVYQKLDKWGRRGDIKAAEQQTVNNRRKRVDLFLSVFLCFGAGLLLSTCFIHMIPEVTFFYKISNEPTTCDSIHSLTDSI